ncbi:MAG: TIGR01777 family oxidoreductase [Gemmatimonadaceae bacterium]
MTSSSHPEDATAADRELLRVAVTGSSGLIGRALVASLATGGHEVRRLVRSRGRLAPGDVYWDPARGEIDADGLGGLDAVVHLAGETVSERWTAAHKRAIRESRVRGTSLLAHALAALPVPPGVLLSASAVGYYGDGGDRELDESSPPGSDFLARVACEWEAAATPAAERGIRVVHPRFGVVMSASGGALERLLPPFRLGAGGKIASGRQWMSWISLDDAVAALHFLLRAGSLAGPVNVTAPNPVTNAEFARTLGRVLHRPAVATVPALALKLMYGEMAEVMLLGGVRALPRRLTEAGFRFRHPTLEEALRREVGAGE